MPTSRYGECLVFWHGLSQGLLGGQCIEDSAIMGRFLPHGAEVGLASRTTYFDSPV